MLSNYAISPTLPAQDINRAKKFYMEKVGLKESSEGSGEPNSASFECGQGTKLYIYLRPPVKVEHTLAGWTVKDLAAEMKELQSRGVTFEEYDFPGLKTINGIATLGTTKAAWFKDSEGNILGLTQKD